MSHIITVSLFAYTVRLCLTEGNVQSNVQEECTERTALYTSGLGVSNRLQLGTRGVEQHLQPQREGRMSWKALQNPAAPPRGCRSPVMWPRRRP